MAGCQAPPSHILVGVGWKFPLSIDTKPGAGDAAIAAGGATTRRMRRRARKNEVACLATRWSENQALPAGANAALDVSEILLEHFDGQAKISAEVVELPLGLSQSFDDLLTSGTFHQLRSAVVSVVSQPLVNRHIGDV